MYSSRHAAGTNCACAEEVHGVLSGICPASDQEGTTKPFYVSLLGAMQWHSARCSLDQRRMTIEVNSVPWSLTAIRDLLRIQIRPVSSQTVKAPDNGASVIGARCSREKPSISRLHDLDPICPRSDADQRLRIARFCRTSRVFCNHRKNKS